MKDFRMMGGIRSSTVLPCLLTLAFAASAFAGISCDEPANRYRNRDIFGSLKETPNIPYGSNKNPLHNNATETLSMDIFQPANDTCTKRPLIIFMYGGGFQGGQRQDETGDCRQFAKRGFVAATIDYRKGNPGPYTTHNFCTPAFMSTQDTRAAIRFFRKNAAQYGIDTSLIFVGGCSSGAYAAMHTAFLDQASEIPSYIDASALDGGIEGNSGNPGFSSKFAGVLSLSGGLFDTTWINKGDIPVAAVQCLQDGIESPDSLHDGTGGKAFVKNFDATRFTPRMNHMGIQILVKSYPQDCHCYHQVDGTGLDLTIDFLAKSAYAIMTARAATSLVGIALSQGDLRLLPPQDGIYDLRGERFQESDPAIKANPASAFHPGLYFRKKSVSGER